MENMKFEYNSDLWNNMLKNSYKIIQEKEDWVKSSGSNFSNVEYFGRLLLINYFKKESFFLKSGDVHSISEMKKKINLQEKYNLLFDKLLDVLEREGFIKIDGDNAITQEKADSEELVKTISGMESFKSALIEKYPDMKPNFILLETCISNYPEIFNGNVSADSVMFPMFSTELVENIFKGNRLVDYFNNLIATVIGDYVSSLSGTIKILEVGSGTGGTSEFVMNMIKDRNLNCEFYFTDISKLFVNKAMKKYSASYPFTKFVKLDIENDLSNQGFEPESFDIIFASNAIHATKFVVNAIDNIYKLLNKNGLLLLNELTAVQDFSTLTFGLMSGWWLFEDREVRMPGSPLLSTGNWKKLLSEKGFININVLSTSSMDKPDSFAQTLILAGKK